LGGKIEKKIGRGKTKNEKLGIFEFFFFKNLGTGSLGLEFIGVFLFY
jgi:hypothetical protein